MTTTWAEWGWRCSYQEKKTGKTKEVVFGCNLEKIQEVGARDDGSVCLTCIENPLWRPLVGKPKEDDDVL